MERLAADFAAESIAADCSSAEAVRSERDGPLHLPNNAAAAIRLTSNTDKPIGVKRINDFEGWVERSGEEFTDAR
jgi:hypothetical protein